MDRAERAGAFFMSGYNCAQSVAMAFADLVQMEEPAVARLASPFGGGMGRMREVCGAVSGMLMIYGILYGYDTSNDDDRKQQVYTQVQNLAGQFREEIGTIICREILDNPPSDPAPSPRTAEYYKERPCARMVMTAAAILERYISAHPLEDGHA